MRSDRERLLDIIEAAEKIAARVQRGRAAFDADEDVRFAVVHLLEIVGEAAGGVSEELRSRTPEVPWSLIIAMRNRIVHGYFDVDHDIVWRAAAEDLPPVATRLREALAEVI